MRSERDWRTAVCYGDLPRQDDCLPVSYREELLSAHQSLQARL